MKVSFPVEILPDITGTLSIDIKLGKEMRAHSLRKGIDQEEIEDAMLAKLSEAAREMASILGVSYDE